MYGERVVTVRVLYLFHVKYGAGRWPYKENRLLY